MGGYLGDGEVIDRSCVSSRKEKAILGIRSIYQRRGENVRGHTLYRI